MKAVGTLLSSIVAQPLWAVQPQGTKWRAIKEDDWRIFDKSPRITPIIWAFPFKALISIAGISGLSTTSWSKTNFYKINGAFGKSAIDFIKICSKKGKISSQCLKSRKRSNRLLQSLGHNYTSPALKQTFRDAIFFSLFLHVRSRKCVPSPPLSHLVPHQPHYVLYWSQGCYSDCCCGRCCFVWPERKKHWTNSILLEQHGTP